MKLDRNINRSGKGKYALVLMRKLPRNYRTQYGLARAIAKNPDAIDNSKSGGPGEFFVIRLKDKYAKHALYAYAKAAHKDDPEYAQEIRQLAKRSGRSHPHCRKPD